MALQLTTSITMTDCCDTLEFCDTTCQPNVCTDCTDGYAVGTNILKTDIARTEFSLVFPDGTIASNLDFGYIPNNRSYAVIELTSGTNGTIGVDMGAGSIGSVVFDTDLQTTWDSLINLINANSLTSGWAAVKDPNNSLRAVIYSTTGGTANNGLGIAAPVTGDMVIIPIVNPIEGGTDETDCLSMTLTEIFALNGGVVLNENTGSSFKDGVYTLTYIVFDAADVEVARTEKKFLIDCSVVNCMKEMMLAEGGCGCDDLDERLLTVRLKIEQAQYQFDEELYDCANETIQKAGDLCSDVCLDC